MAHLPCPACSVPVEADHRFCPSCGARIPVPSVPADPSLARVQEAVGAGFRVTRLVGEGGFAQVFEAEEIQLGRRVAIKVVRPELAARREVVERFQREARAIAALRHPHVMAIHAVGGGDGVAWFVMPLVEGESLRARVEREGVLATAQVARILAQSASALLAAHRAGMVHRDVKPDNILLDGPEGRVLLTDFGIAKALGDGEAALTGSGLLVGTPHFMSPEQAAGDPVDHRSDIYALGVVGYFMATGRLPFEGKSIQSVLAKILTQEPQPVWALRPECPEALVSAVGRALAKDPGDRWEDLAEFLDVLEGRRPPEPVGGFAGLSGWDRNGDGGEPTPPGGGDEALRAYRRSVGVASAAVAVAVASDLALGLGGLSAWLALPVVGGAAVRGGRLWSRGYAWRTLLLGEGGTPAAAPGSLATPVTGEEDFGRHGSLVHAAVKARAAILKCFALMPHQEQERLPHLRDTVEQSTSRVRHLARKVVTLEERIAEASARAEELSESEVAGRATPVDANVAARAHARVRELTGARDAANQELRMVVALLRDVEDGLTASWAEDPARAAQEVARALGQARGVLTA